MSTNSEPWYLNVMSGAGRGPAAAVLRAGLSIVEPFYSAAVSARNRGYDRPGRTRRLPRPVISVGNITAGGTGKTLVVRWLADQLRERGRNVAILSRGYKAAPGAPGDEQRMLDQMLNRFPDARDADTRSFDSRAIAARRPVFLHADPDRHAAGETALAEHPEIDVVLLDDGFQHRRLARDLDLVLIRATEPFGYGHVLPRGLLREPLSGLRRAGAFVLTHADEIGPAERYRISSQVRLHNRDAPIFAATHTPVAIRSAPALDALEEGLPLDRLKSIRAFAFAGIGNPGSFERALRQRCGAYVGQQWFADHHAYTLADVCSVHAAGRAAGADVLITTEKDWVKLAELPAPVQDRQLPIWRLDIAARFFSDDEKRLLERVLRAIDAAAVRSI